MTERASSYNFESAGRFSRNLVRAVGHYKTPQHIPFKFTNSTRKRTWQKHENYKLDNSQCDLIYGSETVL